MKRVREELLNNFWFDLSTKGDQLTLNWKGKPCIVIKTKVLMHAMKTLIVGMLDNAETEDLKKKSMMELDNAAGMLTEEEKDAFTKEWERYVLEHSGRSTHFGRNSRYWNDFVRAATRAKEMGMSPKDYIQAVCAGYSAMNGTDELPFPNQLSGEAAVMFVHRHEASKNVNPIAQAKRKASFNKHLKLGDDEVYLEIRKKFKKGEYSIFDVEYARARLLQEMGELPAWFHKYESRLEGGEKVDGSTGV